MLKSNKDINEVVAALFPEKTVSNARTSPVLSLHEGRQGIAGRTNSPLKTEEPLLS